MGDKGVVVIGINQGGLFGSDAKYVDDYVANLGLTFPVVMDMSSSYTQYVGTDAIAPFPLDVVIGKDGKVTLVSRDFDIGTLKQALEAALAK